MKPTVALALAAVLLLPACRSTGQPHMHEAMDHLKAARAELEAAEADKGGHRVKAIEACDRAIEETRQGMEVGAHR